jgi:hypothetical protein
VAQPSNRTAAITIALVLDQVDNAATNLVLVIEPCAFFEIDRQRSVAAEAQFLRLRQPCVRLAQQPSCDRLDQRLETNLVVKVHLGGPQGLMMSSTSPSGPDALPRTSRHSAKSLGRAPVKMRAPPLPGRRSCIPSGVLRRAASIHLGLKAAEGFFNNAVRRQSQCLLKLATESVHFRADPNREACSDFAWHIRLSFVGWRKHASAQARRPNSEMRIIFSGFYHVQSTCDGLV